MVLIRISVDITTGLWKLFAIAKEIKCNCTKIILEAVRGQNIYFEETQGYLYNCAATNRPENLS